MSSFIDNLDRLNRKERYFLIGMALGNPQFRLDPRFRDKLSDKYGLTIPDTAFVAMDYHLNWIFEAASLSFGTPLRGSMFDNSARVVDGTQEDIDLLVAFEDGSGLHHVIMLEAKGFSSFSNKQFDHKMRRLKAIFGDDGQRWQAVKPHFGLVSNRRPQRLHMDKCPSWLKIDGTIPWFRLHLPDARLVSYRCDEHSNPDQAGAFWTVKSRSPRSR